MKNKLLLGAGLAALIISALHLAPIKSDTLKYTPLLGMPITMGMLPGKAPAVLVPSYLGHSFDGTAQTTYTFSAVDLGEPHATRMIAVYISGRHGGTVSTVTVGGISATSVIASTGLAGARSWIYRAAVTSGSTGDVVVTFTGSVAECAVTWWGMYPSSQVPVDSGQSNSASGTGNLISDIAKTNGGYTIIGAMSAFASTVVTYTQNGAESMTGAAITSGGRTQHVNTATSTTNDYTITFTGNNYNRTVCIASWF
jgi:hypothetical protein